MAPRPLNPPGRQTHHVEITKVGVNLEMEFVPRVHFGKEVGIFILFTEMNKVLLKLPFFPLKKNSTMVLYS